MSKSPKSSSAGPSLLTASQKLIRGVQRRMQIDAIAKYFLGWLVVLAILFGVGVLVTRGTGYGLGVFNPWTAAAILPLALLGACLTYRRPTPKAAARMIDRFKGTKDLFLATVMLDNAVGDYKPLVSHSAEEIAGTLSPTRIVQFHWGQPLRTVLLTAAVVVVCFFFMPQFDPFGKIQASVVSQEEQKELAKLKNETQVRLAEIKRQEEQSVEARQIGKELQALKQALKAAKPSEPQKNLEAIASRQKSLGDQWRKMNAEKMKSLLSKGVSSQEFGQDSPKFNKWMKELEEGKTDSLKKELAEIKQQMKELAETKDPAKKAELEQKLKKRLRDVHEFAKNKATQKKLAQALDRAMKQLNAGAKSEQLSKDAKEAMEKSMELSQEELEQISKDAKQMKDVEKAMEVAQLAKQLNQMKKLNGEECEKCQSMEDYEALFKELMAEMGQGEGQGDQGEGEGKAAEEDESSKTKFKTETATSPVTAGKMLMSLKSQGKGEKGDSTEKYQNLMRSVKQGVSEAIQQEQIPPGYHDSIKSYFQDLDKEDASPKK
ncbi:MAG: hypothetical protein U0903_10695 [Planctomycetales bacterium]